VFLKKKILGRERGDHGGKGDCRVDDVSFHVIIKRESQNGLASCRGGEKAEMEETGRELASTIKGLKVPEKKTQVPAKNPTLHRRTRPTKRGKRRFDEKEKR